MKSLRDMTEPELHSYFRELAGLMESVMPFVDNARGRALFMLIVFDDPGVAQYVSNANRSDCIKALREAADRLERNETIPRTSGDNDEH